MDGFELKYSGVGGCILKKWGSELQLCIYLSLDADPDVGGHIYRRWGRSAALFSLLAPRKISFEG